MPLTYSYSREIIDEKVHVSMSAEGFSVDSEDMGRAVTLLATTYPDVHFSQVVDNTDPLAVVNKIIAVWDRIPVPYPPTLENDIAILLKAFKAACEAVEAKPGIDLATNISYIEALDRAFVTVFGTGHLIELG